MKFIFTLVSLVLLPSEIHCSLTASLFQKYNFQITLFKDISDNMGIEEVKYLLKTKNAFFRPADKISGPFSPYATYWLYIKPDTTVHYRDFVLSFKKPVSNVEVYPYPYSNITDYGGLLTAGNNKTLSGSNVALNSYDSPYLVKVQNKIRSDITTKDIFLTPAIVFQKKQQFFDFLQGLIQGSFLLMFLYNLFFLITTKRKVYLFYVFYVLFNSLYLLYSFNYTEQYIFPDSALLNLFFLSFQLLGLFFYIMFLRQVFLQNCSSYTSHIDKRLFLPYCYLLLLSHLIIGSTTFYRIDIFAKTVALLNVFHGIIAIISFLYFYKNTNTFAKTIMLGSVFMITGGFITTLKDLFFLPSDIIFYETGLLLELIIFSYALNRQHVLLEKEKNKAELLNRKLEYEAIKRENIAREQFAMKLLESQENERNRIALELHDSIGQKLLLIKNQLLSGIRIATDEVLVKSLKGISEITGDTIEEIRNISRNLRPQHLDQLGLKTAIETLVELIENSSDIKYNLYIDEIDGLITHEHEINFYRIIQESLNNIVKHSKASEAFIQIKKTTNSIDLRIEDNGVGISSLNKNSYRGIGIAGIQQRAKMMGGVLTIHAMEKGGTLIEMNYPLKPEIIIEQTNG